MAAFMKVLLSIHEIDYQKVHDLGLLADILNEKNIEAGLDTDLLIELSDYAVKGRYTFIHEDINNVKRFISMLSQALSTPRD